MKAFDGDDDLPLSFFADRYLIAMPVLYFFPFYPDIKVLYNYSFYEIQYVSIPST